MDIVVESHFAITLKKNFALNNIKHQRAWKSFFCQMLISYLNQVFFIQRYFPLWL